MSYNEFTLSDVIEKFNLKILEKPNIFKETPIIKTSSFLQETLAENLPLILI